MLVPYFKEICQLGYVTRNLDAAMGRFKVQGGIRAFATYDAELDVVAQGRADRARIRVALANVGPMQVEIIEPVEGAIEVYREGAPDADVFLHHVAALVRGSEADWHAALRSAPEHSKPVIEGEGGRAWGTLTRFAYFDLRSRFGHFLELIWRSPGAQAVHEAMPDQSA